MALIGKHVCIKILKSKIYIFSTSFVCLVSTAILLFYSTISPYRIFPLTKNLKIDFYIDTLIGGNSKITHKITSDSLLSVSFTLGTAIQSPFIGITIQDKNHKALNLKHYNKISIVHLSTGMENVNVGLITKNNYSEIANKTDEIIYGTTVGISKKIKKHTIYIDQFRSPDWWKIIKDIPENVELKANPQYITAINIGNGYSKQIKGTKTISIKSILFERDNSTLIYSLLEIIILFAVSLYTILVLIHIIRSLKISIEITYKPIEDVKKDDSTTEFLYYINNNFHNCDLSLEIVANQTKTNQRTITTQIQKTFDCNFKTYLNRLRMNESKRLLLETEMFIGEIAYKVGFNNQTHFNRVFKAEMGISPSEYRDKNKKTQVL